MKFLKVFEKGLSHFSRQNYLLKKRMKSNTKKVNLEFRELFYEFLIFLERPQSNYFKWGVLYFLMCVGINKLDKVTINGDITMLMLPVFISIHLFKRGFEAPFQVKESVDKNFFKISQSEMLEYY